MASLFIAGQASAATTVLYSTFETPDVATGSYGIFAMADGWTTATGPGIEIQDHAGGGDPAPIVGGNQFVELDSNSNSSMFYTLANAGRYTMSFLYSPRPNVVSESNQISAYIDGILLSPPGTLQGTTSPNTSWALYSTGTFTAKAGDKVSFAAQGTSESYGGYLDNIRITAVPEPATWGLMIVGFGAIGASIRSTRRRQFAATA